MSLRTTNQEREIHPLLEIDYDEVCIQNISVCGKKLTNDNLLKGRGRNCDSNRIPKIAILSS